MHTSSLVQDQRPNTTHYTSAHIFNEHTSRPRPVAHRLTLTALAMDVLSNRIAKIPVFLIGNEKYRVEYEAPISTSLGSSRE